VLHNETNELNERRVKRCIPKERSVFAGIPVRVPGIDGILNSFSVPEDQNSKVNRWKQRLEQAQAAIWADEPAHPVHVYHYSSLNNIRSVLSARQLWLFDVRSMPNDPGDGIYRIDLFYSVLVNKSVPRWLVQHFRPGGTLGLGSAWHSYVSCFSTESDLEDVWDQFGDHGKGCAIELSFPAFRESSDGGKAYGWTPMFYDRGEQRDAPRRQSTRRSGSTVRRART
jgi:hypothetical protein